MNLLVEEDEEEGVRGGSSAPLGTGAIFRADVDNPDLANALSESIIEELKLLRKVGSCQNYCQFRVKLSNFYIERQKNPCAIIFSSKRWHFAETRESGRSIRK